MEHPMQVTVSTAKAQLSKPGAGLLRTVGREWSLRLGRRPM